MVGREHVFYKYIQVLMKEQMRQMLQYTDWIKGEMPNKPTRKTHLKQEHIRNVVINYEEIKAGPGGHL